MSVEIPCRSAGSSVLPARRPTRNPVIPWALVGVMASYIAGSHLWGGAQTAREIECLDPPAAPAVRVVERLGETVYRTAGQIAAYGRIRNRSRLTLSDIEPVIELYDRQGRVVGVAKGLTTDRRIAAGRTTTFEAYADDRDDIAGYRVAFHRLGGGSIGP